MKKIEVGITFSEIFSLSKFDMDEPFAMEKLRLAGVPVLGFLNFRGVERGILTKEYDPFADGFAIKFIWIDQ